MQSISDTTKSIADTTKPSPGRASTSPCFSGASLSTRTPRRNHKGSIITTELGMRLPDEADDHIKLPTIFGTSSLNDATFHYV